MNPILISPKIDDDATVQMQLKQMKSYLFQFKEQMEMMLQNIDRENLSGTMVKDIDTIRGGIRQYEVKINGFSSKIAQTENMISAKLSSEDVDAEFLLQRLNDGSTTALLRADRIDVEGVFSANNSFEVAENGDLTFKGAGININTSSDSTDTIQLNASVGVGTNFLKLAPRQIEVGNTSSGYAKILGGARQFSIAYHDDVSIQNPILQYSDVSKKLQINRSGCTLSVNDGSVNKNVHWTPLNSLTSDMYVLTDGGT